MNKENILILGPKKRNIRILEGLKNRNIRYSISDDYPTPIEVESFTHLVSSGFSRKIAIDILNKFSAYNRLNIHPSYLPFGKGIGGCLASLIYPTTLGSSLHLLSEEFDCGDILTQAIFSVISNKLTHSQLYDLWIDHSLQLFLDNLDNWLNKKLIPLNQNTSIFAPYLNRDDAECFHELLSHSWNTSVEEINRLSVSLAMRAAAIKFYEIANFDQESISANP
jgi:methionyl-tRNA formyltransferase